MPDASLYALLGERVTVTNPAVGSSWTGRLIGLHDDPGIMIEQEGADRIVCLPQSFEVRAAPALPEAPAAPGHKCAYPPHGDLLGRPDDRCVTCEQQRPASRMVAVGEVFLRRVLRDALCFAEYHATAGDLDSPQYIREYEVALLELADALDATTPRAEWGVAYEGDEMSGAVGALLDIREYDDREDAEAAVLIGADVLVTRTVTATPWQRVEVSR